MERWIPHDISSKPQFHRQRNLTIQILGWGWGPGLHQCCAYKGDEYKLSDKHPVLKSEQTTPDPEKKTPGKEVTLLPSENPSNLTIISFYWFVVHGILKKIREK